MSDAAGTGAAGTGAGGTGADAVTVRPFTPADTLGVLALLERAFDLPAQPERFDWVYARNAGGAPATSVVAEAEAEAGGGPRIVGFHGALPVRLWHGGREVRGLYTLEVATDPDFQGRGIFTKLGRAIVEAARADGTQVIRIFPNLQSAPGFYGKLGYTELKPFPVLARLLGNTRGPIGAQHALLWPVAALADSLLWLKLTKTRLRALRLSRRGTRVEPLTHGFGPWADALWESLRDGMGTTTVRDARFLQWRYIEGPHRYALLALRRGDGDPVGFAVVSIRFWKGGKAAELMELMVAPDDRAGAELLVAEAVLLAARTGAVALRTWVSPLHPHAEVFRTAGYRALPARLSADYSFGVQVLDPSGLDVDEVQSMAGWTITTGDIEYI